MNKQSRLLEALRAKQNKLAQQEQQLVAEIERRQAGENRKLCISVGSAMLLRSHEPKIATLLLQMSSGMAPRQSENLKTFLASKHPPGSQNEFPLPN